MGVVNGVQREVGQFQLGREEINIHVPGAWTASAEIKILIIMQPKSGSEPKFKPELASGSVASSSMFRYCIEPDTQFSSRSMCKQESVNASKYIRTCLNQYIFGHVVAQFVLFGCHWL